MKLLASLLGRLVALLAIWRRVVTGHRAEELPEEEVDPSERQVMANRTAEGLVALLLTLAGCAGLAYLIFYIVDDNTQLLGLTAGLALLFLAVAFMLASLRVVPQVTEVEERSQLDHGEEAQEEIAEEIREGGEGISRRKLLAGAGGVAAVGVGVGVVATPLASLGPRLQNRLSADPWERGKLVVDPDDKPISADELPDKSFLTGFPEGADKEDMGAAVIIVRLAPRYVHPAPDRVDWSPEGIFAYSKICTHAGCAIAMYRYPLSPSTTGFGPALVCPCHYSTFDPGRGAYVKFGPAGRPLPQLPLFIDGQRLLRAAGKLSGPPGPAWWGTPYSYD